MSLRKKVMVTLCVAIAALSWAYIGGGQADRMTRYSASTYSTGPWGCKALYQVLAELQLPVKRFRQSFPRLRSHQGVLVITGPLRSPMSEREKVAIRQWIETGNQLLVCDGRFAAPLTRTKGTEYGRTDDRAPVPVMTSPSTFLEVRLKQLPDTVRQTLTVTLPDLHASARISVSGESRWEHPPKEWSTLIEDEDGAILIARPMGKGRVVALSDVTLASNLHLGNEQNLRLILALLLSRGKPQEILFDEFHQGHGAEHSLSTYVGSSILLWAIMQGVIGVGLFFFAKRAQYAGRYRSLASPKGRSSLEYVDSMAGVYQSCKAGSVALEALLNRFLARLSRRTGLPLKRLSETSSHGIAALVPNGQEDLAALITRCRVVAQTGQETPEALSLAQRLVSARRSIKGFEQTERPRR